jgi:hypothetical protein
MRIPTRAIMYWHENDRTKFPEVAHDAEKSDMPLDPKVALAASDVRGRPKPTPLPRNQLR